MFQNIAENATILSAHPHMDICTEVLPLPSPDKCRGSFGQDIDKLMANQTYPVIFCKISPFYYICDSNY